MENGHKISPIKTQD